MQKLQIQICTKSVQSKTAKKTIVEWSLKDINKPLGVSTYQLEEVVARTVEELEQQKENARK